MENNDCLDRSRANKMVESVATKWTNEKHKSYLNHIEASFIEQLHSNELFDGSWKTPIHAAASHGLVPKSQLFCQFKVRRRGCLENSEYENSVNKNGSEHERIEGHSANFKKAKQFCFHRLNRDTIDRVTEVSDQNFVDENVADEGISKRRRKKRSRTVSTITDQVVPFVSIAHREDGGIL